MKKILNEYYTYGYFYKYVGHDKLILTKDLHIHYIIKHPSTFGLSKEIVNGIYELNNEKLGTEGKSRQTILNLVLKNGWIRIRNTNISWFVEIWNFDKNILRHFLDFMIIDKKLMKFSDKIKIITQIKEDPFIEVKNLYQLLESTR